MYEREKWDFEWGLNTYKKMKMNKQFRDYCCAQSWWKLLHKKGGVKVSNFFANFLSLKFNIYYSI